MEILYMFLVMAGIALLIVQIALIVKLFKLCNNMQELRDYLIDGKKVIAYYDEDTLSTVGETVYGKDLLSPISEKEWNDSRKERTEKAVQRAHAQQAAEAEKPIQ